MLGHVLLSYISSAGCKYLLLRYAPAIVSYFSASTFLALHWRLLWMHGLGLRLLQYINLLEMKPEYEFTFSAFCGSTHQTSDTGLVELIETSIYLLFHGKRIYKHYSLPMFSGRKHYIDGKKYQT